MKSIIIILLVFILFFLFAKVKFAVPSVVSNELRNDASSHIYDMKDESYYDIFPKRKNKTSKYTVSVYSDDSFKDKYINHHFTKMRVK